MFEFSTTATEVRDLADTVGCSVSEAKQLLYREARLRYMLELEDRIAQVGDIDTLIDAVQFLLRREIEKNS